MDGEPGADVGDAPRVSDIVLGAGADPAVDPRGTRRCGHVEHGAARDQEGQPGRPRDELDVQRRCFSEVLGVVDDEQELA